MLINLMHSCVIFKVMEAGKNLIPTRILTGLEIDSIPVLARKN